MPRNKGWIFETIVTLFCGGMVFGGIMPENARAQALPINLRNTLESQQRIDPGTLLDYAEKTLESEEKKRITPLQTLPPEIHTPVLEADQEEETNGPQFFVSTISVSGVSVFDDATIRELVTPFTGKELTMKDLLTLKSQLVQRYRDNGYITTRVFLPPQEVSGGTVNFQVVEGLVGEITIEGLRHLDKSYIEKRLDLSSGDVFKLQTLEKALRKLNQGSLVQLKADIQPGEKFGTSDIVLYANELRPLSIIASTDNQGRENIGFYRTGISLDHRNFLGLGDSLSLNSLLSLSEWGHDGSQSFFGTYRIPVGSRGIEIGAAVSSGFTQVGGPISRLDIHGRSHTLGLFASGPLWAGTHQNLSWNAGLDSKRSLQFLGDLRFPDLGIPNTEVRTAHAGLTWTMHDRFGKTMLQNEISQGVQAFGGRESFLKYTLDLTRIQSLMRDAYLIGHFGGQLTPNNLVSMEQFQIGGAQSVRGYQEGALIGDEGYYASLELRLPLSFFSNQWTPDFQILSFLEAGSIGINRSTQTDTNGGTPGNIRSVGVGLRAKLARQLFGRLDAGFSMTDNQNEPTARIHFGLSSILF